MKVAMAVLYTIAIFVYIYTMTTTSDDINEARRVWIVMDILLTVTYAS